LTIHLVITGDGQIIQPTNKKFQSEFSTIATWKDGKITEERIFYDLGVVMTKIDAMSSKT
jgi:ketosteroid isomerase-like protein